MHECSGEMRYWENHYDKVQAGVKLKEAETTFQNITLDICLLPWSGHSVIRSNSRYIKVNWNQGEFFKVDKNPGSQSQDQIFSISSSFCLEDSVGNRLSSLSTWSLLCSSITGGRGGTIWAPVDRARMSCYLILDRALDSQRPAFTQAVQETYPSATWMPFFKERVKVLKGQTFGIWKLGSSNDFAKLWCLRISLFCAPFTHSLHFCFFLKQFL